MSSDRVVVLEVTGARKSYGATEALCGADLRLFRGEWLSLLGPNGAGKTTLIRAIAGRVRLDAGTMTLLGRPLGGIGSGGAEDEPGARGESGARRELGVIPQDLALYPRLTARENLEVFGSLQGLSGALLKERCEWALKFTALADRAKEPAGGFSGGMKRRLNIACGVLHRPDVVLLDEPTVGVDPQSRQRIYEMLDELRSGGASLLMTTHQLDEVQQHSGRIVIIDHGRVIAEGTADELIARTLGKTRTVLFRLDRPAPPLLIATGLAPPGATGPAPSGTPDDAALLRAGIGDMNSELPAWLGRIGAAGCRVLDLTVEAPTLHAVFLHLTGRELRE